MSFSLFGASPTGTKRLHQEFSKILQTDTQVEGYTITLVEDNIYKWHVKLFGFEGQLAEDLFIYESSRPGRDHVLIEVIFPRTYPSSPPFMRVIYPQFHQFTGHITVGGAICVKELTMSGWVPGIELSSFFVMIRNLLLEGSALIDMNRTHNDYIETEAREAFIRTCQTHGWSFK
eukprot:TRINITY_DN4137_c0_g1_i9.p1 TRINITY_DN4137_c0_g1~~TRINITY_DN4137_c0_g1_i9.p1  ORF type:complete len:196 (+),score=32.29 TRINITY_DN4137_c0_g1_i9:64-588(+)